MYRVLYSCLLCLAVNVQTQLYGSKVLFGIRTPWPVPAPESTLASGGGGAKESFRRAHSERYIGKSLATAPPRGQFFSWGARPPAGAGTVLDSRTLVLTGVHISSQKHWSPQQGAKLLVIFVTFTLSLTVWIMQIRIMLLIEFCC